MDVMKIEILEDGMVSITTDKVSDVNHASADALLDELENMLGGRRETKDRTPKGTSTVLRHRHMHSHRHAKVGS